MKEITAKQKQILESNQIQVSNNASLLAKQYGDEDRSFVKDLSIFFIAFIIFLSFIFLKVFLSDDNEYLLFYVIMDIIAFLCLSYTIYKRIVYLKKHCHNLLIMLDDNKLICYQEKETIKVDLSSIFSSEYSLYYFTRLKKSVNVKYGSLTLHLNNEETIIIENVGHVKKVSEELSQIIK